MVTQGQDGKSKEADSYGQLRTCLAHPTSTCNKGCEFLPWMDHTWSWRCAHLLASIPSGRWDCCLSPERCGFCLLIPRLVHSRHICFHREKKETLTVQKFSSRSLGGWWGLTAGLSFTWNCTEKKIQTQLTLRSSEANLRKERWLQGIHSRGKALRALCNLGEN